MALVRRTAAAGEKRGSRSGRPTRPSTDALKSLRRRKTERRSRMPAPDETFTEVPAGPSDRTGGGSRDFKPTLFVLANPLPRSERFSVAARSDSHCRDRSWNFELPKPHFTNKDQAALGLEEDGQPARSWIGFRSQADFLDQSRIPSVQHGGASALRDLFHSLRRALLASSSIEGRFASNASSGTSFPGQTTWISASVNGTPRSETDFQLHARVSIF